MTNEPIDALLKTGGSPGGEAEEDEDDQNLMEEEARCQLIVMIVMIGMNMNMNINMNMNNMNMNIKGKCSGGQVAAHQGPDELHARLERRHVPLFPCHC